jgi:hypothetical protein
MYSSFNIVQIWFYDGLMGQYGQTSCFFKSLPQSCELGYLQSNVKFYNWKMNYMIGLCFNYWIFIWQCDWSDWKIHNCIHMGALHLSCPKNWKFGIWIMKMKINNNITINTRIFIYMKYTHFQIRSWNIWLQFYYHKSIKLEEYMFKPPCGFSYQVQPMCKYYKMPNA